MSDEILYRRTLPNGPVVRIRRTSAPGASPVIAVLDVDRRAGTPREKEGTPPPLRQAQGATEDEVVATLKKDAEDDRVVAGLMRAKAQR
jgi:hypothetical protein